ncbi:MAG: secretin N-terminal domain-containing protein, partial [Chlamydiota bacterium]
MKALVRTGLLVSALAAFSAWPAGLLRAQPTPGVVPEMPGAAGAVPPAAAKTDKDTTGGGVGSDAALVQLDLDNVELKTVIKLFSDLMGKNFLLSDSVRTGTVSVMSPMRIPVDELPKVLESILEVRGLAAVPVGDIIKIIPRQEAAKSPIELETEAGVRDRIPDETFVTQIIPLQYASLEEVKGLAQALSGKNASVIAYTPANTLIISDSASNLGRLMKIIKEVDIPGLESTITVVPLQYAAASIMAEEVLSIIAGKGAGSDAGAGQQQVD